jgi:hypothetical protein
MAQHLGSVPTNSFPRGEAHPEAKLTERDVREIRRRRALGEPAIDIADDYEIDPSNVCQIALRRTWGWLD